MEAGLYKKRKSSSVVNIVPLVDVLIVLIFFFLMTMQFRNQNMLDITPPSMESAGQQQVKENTIIAVDKEGQFFLNDEEITLPDLEDSMLSLAQKSPASPVLLLADQDSALKHMTSVIDISKKAGLEQVRLQVK